MEVIMNDEGGMEDEDQDDIEDIPGQGLEHRQIEAVLSVVWGGGRLGAAYYNAQTFELFLLPDTAEAAPDFEVLRQLFRQVTPGIIVGCARQDNRFLEVLRQLSGEAFPESRTDYSSQSTASGAQSLASQSGNERPNLFIQPGREFAPDACKRRLLELHLPEESPNTTEQEHLYFITSLIPLSNIGMVRAAGALLKFLDKRGLELLRLDMITGKTPVLDVKICTMTDLVLVDYTAWDSLQIFNPDGHPGAATKQSIFASGGINDGLSLYSLMNRTLTAQGSSHLRLQLLRPTRNFAVLNRRHDVIQHCVNLAHTAFVESVTDSLKNISNLPKLLQRLSVLHPTVKEWKQLYKTLHSCIVIGQACAAQPSSIQLFEEISRVFKQDIVLSSVTRELARVIDFEQSTIHRRFYPQPGLNEALDEKREQYDSLQGVMSTIANEEFDSLPEFIGNCSIVYLPEVGYLLCIKVWGQNLAPEEIILQGLEYKFTSSDSAYYQSSRTQELDILLGDAQVAILELENYIKLALTENILRHSSSLLKINALIAELDSLLALASVARENNYVRPAIVSGLEKLEICNGRHPLIELNYDFVPNSTVFAEHEDIVILTGPNASGKSVYLKQVGIIAIMALAGSFVPAKSAIIPAFDRICTRIYAQESITVGLSTFMLDINQMSLAQRNATRASLVIVDEFGKGTGETDGLSLLIATLEDFAHRGLNCPTIFVSTHYNSLLDRLPMLPIFKPQTMEFLMERDSIVQLFKLKDGRCQSSFACMVATETGTPAETVARSYEIENILRRDVLDTAVRPVTFQEEKESLLIKVAENFQNLQLDEINPHEYLQTIFELLNPFMGTDQPGDPGVDVEVNGKGPDRIVTPSTSSSDRPGSSAFSFQNREYASSPSTLPGNSPLSRVTPMPPFGSVSAPFNSPPDFSPFFQ